MVVGDREADELSGFRNRKRPPEKSIQETEDRRRGADTEREREDGNQRKSGVLAYHSNAVEQVFQEIGSHVSPSCASKTPVLIDEIRGSVLEGTRVALFQPRELAGELSPNGNVATGFWSRLRLGSLRPRALPGRRPLRHGSLRRRDPRPRRSPSRWRAARARRGVRTASGGSSGGASRRPSRASGLQ